MKMENRNIILVLTVIIVILAILLCAMFAAKEKSNLSIADKNINAGDSLVVKLTDSNGNPVSAQTVNLKITDRNGKKTIDEHVTTNSKGKAKFTIDEKGKYTVECKFDGNNQLASSSIKEDVNVEKATTTVVGNQQSSTSKHSSKYAPDGGIYPEYGPEVDSQGITREYAIANDMHYLEITVDGDRPGEYVTVGGYTRYDPVAGSYHT